MTTRRHQSLGLTIYPFNAGQSPLANDISESFSHVPTNSANEADPCLLRIWDNQCLKLSGFHCVPAMPLKLQRASCYTIVASGRVAQLVRARR